MKSVLIIDDSYMIQSTIKDYITKSIGNCGVDAFCMIPIDEAILADYEIIIMDGQGVGNKKYSNGLEFCRAYTLTGNNKAVIYYSGLSPDKKDREILAKKRVSWTSKVADPQILVDMVKKLLEE